MLLVATTRFLPRVFCTTIARSFILMGYKSYFCVIGVRERGRVWELRWFIGKG